MEKGYEDWGELEHFSRSSELSRAEGGEVMIENKTKGRMVFSSSFAIKEPVATLALSNVCRAAIFGLVRTLARSLDQAESE